MGGGQTSKGGGGSSKVLEAQGKQVFDESTPMRQELLGQMTELMRTGATPGAQVPIIQRAVEAQRQAQSGAYKAAVGSLAGAGLGDDPYSRGLLASQQTAGDMTTAAIPTQIGQQMLGMAPNLAMGFPQIAGTNVANAGNVQNSAKGMEIQTMGQMFNTARGAPGGKGFCWVAEVLYGKWDQRTYAARRWVSTHDNTFTRAYRQHGRSWAIWLERWPYVRPVVRPIWDAMAWAGR